MMEHKKMKKRNSKKISKHVENDGDLDATVEENEKEKHKDGKRRRREKGRVVIVNGASDSVKDGEKEKNKSLKKKKRKTKEGYNAVVDDAEEEHTKVKPHNESSAAPVEADGGAETHSLGKYKKHGKKKKKGSDSLSAVSMEKRRKTEHDEVYNISSVDEDCSRGMKKWIAEYHQSRPGLKILQQRIDEFIISHEARLEQERKEKEAQAAEGGWTVVVHHKGRKKTTDAETGITMGSVAQAAVEDKMAKKKNKEVGVDFYRFQKREAQRNEIMALQNKFEQDKKRIQQLRAARKFRPY